MGMAVTDWTFDGSWPYEPKWFDSDDGRMHYVDQGPPDGRPVGMGQGNPTWGYLYRHFIPRLVGADRHPGLPAGDPGHQWWAGGRDEQRDRGRPGAGLSLQAGARLLGD